MSIVGINDPNQTPSRWACPSWPRPGGGRPSLDSLSDEVLGGLNSSQCLWQQLILPSDCSRTSSISSMMARSALPSWSALYGLPSGGT